MSTPPILRLPAEIMGLILANASYDTEDQATHAQVCRQWKSIILHDPSCKLLRYHGRSRRETRDHELAQGFRPYILPATHILFWNNRVEVHAYKGVMSPHSFAARIPYSTLYESGWIDVSLFAEEPFFAPEWYNLPLFASKNAEAKYPVPKGETLVEKTWKDGVEFRIIETFTDKEGKPYPTGDHQTAMCESYSITIKLEKTATIRQFIEELFVIYGKAVKLRAKGIPSWLDGWASFHLDHGWADRPKDVAGWYIGVYLDVGIEEPELPRMPGKLRPLEDR